MTETTGDAEELQRPDRTAWVKLRREQGRATSDNWTAGAILLGYQRRIMEACERHDVVFVEKSRRTGATWGAAADAVLRSAAPRSDGGMDTLYVGTSYDMAKEFVDAVAMWARLFDKACRSMQEMLFDDGSRDGIKALRIDFASGFSVVALSSKPRSLRGRQGFVILDEAAFADSLEELLKAAMALLMWGGRVLVISTHNGDANPFNLVIRDIRAGRLSYGLVRFDLDDALRDGLYERIAMVNAARHGAWSPEKEADWREKLVRDYRDAADEELYCIPSQGSGVFLPGPLIEARMIEGPVLRLAPAKSFFALPEARKTAEIEAWIADYLAPVMAMLDPLLQSALGMDVGRYRDLSVLAPMQIGRTLRRVVPFLIEMDAVPFAQQRQVAAALWRGLPRRLGFRIDATGIGAGIAEDLQVAEGAEPVKITTEWYRTELPPFKAAFEDDLIAIVRDADVLADLRALKVRQGVPVLPALRQSAATGGTRHGDAAIAIVLAYGASRGAGESFDYQPVRSGVPLDPDWDDEPATSTEFGRPRGGLW